jgi:hypothetical protein
MGVREISPTTAASVEYERGHEDPLCCQARNSQRWTHKMAKRNERYFDVIVWTPVGVVQIRVTTFGKAEAAWGTKRADFPMDKVNAIVKMIEIIEAVEWWGAAFEQKYVYQSPTGPLLPKVNIGAIEGGAPYRPNYFPGRCNIGGSSGSTSTDRGRKRRVRLPPTGCELARHSNSAKRRKVTARFWSHRTAEGLRPRGHIELGKFRITINAAVWVRNVNISGAVAHKLNGLLDGRHGRVPFERQHSC